MAQTAVSAVAQLGGAGVPVGSKRKQEVLEEDEWTALLEDIVARDFFPDVPKLQSKLEWLQALRTGDPDLRRQAQVNIAQRRAGLRTPVGGTPLQGWAGASMLRTPAGFQTPGAATPSVQGGRPVPVSEPAAPAPPSMSLDAFLAGHTSEDNASFAEIMVDAAKRKRQRQPWLFEPQQLPLLEGSRDTDGYGSTGQPGANLLSWPHNNVNRVFYDNSNFEPLALSNKERAELVQGKPKAIVHSNTRLAAASQEEELPQTGASRQVPGGEYAHVATPSMEPGVDTTPLMTWGQLGGTPLRLDPPDPTESYASGSKAPEFRILNAPEREQLGRHISQKATASLKHDTVGTRTPLHGTPLATPRSAQATPLPRGQMMGPPPPRHAAAATPGKPPLSAAGRKLACTLRTPSTADAQLRATYSGRSRLGVPGHSPTPGGWDARSPTPDIQAISRLARERLEALEKQAPGSKITDNLLQMPS